jgi:catechol 2,3-dioxygenase-like lactoylglutathione lyase family enzyme
MSSYQRAVPVLQVADVEKSLRWYVDILGFTPNTFPEQPPYSFAILKRDEAEIMLQCVHELDFAAGPRAPDPELVWTVYLRVAGTTILDAASAVAQSTPLLRGPERMFYGLVEFELCDPDGYRVCVGGEAPPGANVKLHQASDSAP